MSELPVIGASMMIGNIPSYLDFLKEKDRDLEIQDFRGHRTLDGDWQAMADKALALLGEFKGRIGIHGPSTDLTIAPRDSAIQKVVNKRCHQALDAAERLGAVYMVLHSPYSAWVHNDLPHNYGAEDQLHDCFATTMRDVIDRAYNMGLTIVIENVQDSCPFDRLKMIEAIGSPALAASVDTGHAEFAHRANGAPPVDQFVVAAGNLLRHVHLQDADGYADRHWQIGKGNVHWHAVFNAICHLSIQPHLMLELYNTADIFPSIEFLSNEGLAQ